MLLRKLSKVVFLILILSIGCTRTIYVPEREPVMLREDIPNVKIWALDKNGEPVKGELDLKEGWYVLSDPGQE